MESCGVVALLLICSDAATLVALLGGSAPLPVLLRDSLGLPRFHYGRNFPSSPLRGSSSSSLPPRRLPPATLLSAVQRGRRPSPLLPCLLLPLVAAPTLQLHPITTPTTASRLGCACPSAASSGRELVALLTF